MHTYNALRSSSFKHAWKSSALPVGSRMMRTIKALMPLKIALYLVLISSRKANTSAGDGLRPFAPQLRVAGWTAIFALLVDTACIALRLRSAAALAWSAAAFSWFICIAAKLSRDSFMISANPESMIALSADPPDIVEVAGVDIPAGFANLLALAGVRTSSLPMASRIIAKWVSGKRFFSHQYSFAI